MYKTVRQGENSLQYTILPQQEEAVGSTGHKTSSGLCRGRSRRSKRGRATTIIIMLIVACSIVAGAILVPLLLTTDVIGFRKLAASQPTNQHVVIHRHRLSQLVHHEENVTTPTTTTTTTPEENFNTLTTGTNAEISKAENVSLKTVEDDIGTFSTMKPDLETTQAVTAVTERAVELSSVATLKPRKVNDTVDEGGEGNATLVVLRAPGTTRIVVEATVPGAGDRNWTDTPEVVIAKVTRPTVDPYRGWLPPRWPFADPSSYLQWTGYGSDHDSLLLPLLLGVVLVILIIILIFCYFMRRKHQKYLRREAIGKMSSDLQCDEAGDKSSLLPETNSEEE